MSCVYQQLLNNVFSVSSALTVCVQDMPEDRSNILCHSYKLVTEFMNLIGII